MMSTTVKISESTDSIRVRIGTALLTVSGDARELIDADTVANEIEGLDCENAICTLYGLGFEQRGNALGGRRNDGTDAARRQR